MPSDEMVEKALAAWRSFATKTMPDWHTHAMRAAIAAALAAAEAETKPVAWTNIASAPKDGTWVLLKGGEPDEDYDFETPKPPCVVARYVEVSHQDGSPLPGRWYFASYDSGYYGRWLDPTHWMPLAAPSEAAVRAGERTAIRKEAFEEAARIAEATKNYDDNLQRSAGALPCGERIATAIRARGE